MKIDILPIDDILDTTERTVTVLLAETGKPVVLSRRHIDFKPGAVIVPLWLSNRLKGNNFTRRQSGGPTKKEESHATNI